jgi:hypothetical protein
MMQLPAYGSAQHWPLMTDSVGPRLRDYTILRIATVLAATSTAPIGDLASARKFAAEASQKPQKHHRIAKPDEC